MEYFFEMLKDYNKKETIKLVVAVFLLCVISTGRSNIVELRDLISDVPVVGIIVSFPFLKTVNVFLPVLYALFTLFYLTNIYFGYKRYRMIMELLEDISYDDLLDDIRNNELLLSELKTSAQDNPGLDDDIKKCEQHLLENRQTFSRSIDKLKDLFFNTIKDVSDIVSALYNSIVLIFIIFIIVIIMLEIQEIPDIIFKGFVISSTINFGLFIGSKIVEVRNKKIFKKFLKEFDSFTEEQFSDSF